MSSQLVEKLYRLKWGIPDGLGGLIISPTRELAMQIFDELRKVGQKHDLSAGLLIGGKNVKDERDRVNGGELALHLQQPSPLWKTADRPHGHSSSLGNSSRLVIQLAV